METGLYPTISGLENHGPGCPKSDAKRLIGSPLS